MGDGDDVLFDMMVFVCVGLARRLDAVFFGCKSSLKQLEVEDERVFVLVGYEQ